MHCSAVKYSVVECSVVQCSAVLNLHENPEEAEPGRHTTPRVQHGRLAGADAIPQPGQVAPGHQGVQAEGCGRH